MPSATLRENEAATLKVLHELELLDTSAEAEYDALVASAAQVLRVPTALISLVDEKRQWFKARVGLEDLSETPRNIAFCAHAVLQEDIFEVQDTLQDARFRSNPFVTGPAQIRFYAGAPLSVASGSQIGTLCILDTVPRQLTAEERLLLKGLAKAVGHSIELRLARRRLDALTNPRTVPRQSVAKLVVDAAGTVDVAIDRLFERGADSSPLFEPELMFLEEAEDVRMASLAKLSDQEQLALTAVHLCLVASSSLLGATAGLIHSSRYMAPADRSRAWSKLADDTKTAGFAAYRAARVLADREAAWDLLVIDTKKQH